ncbi:dolichol kinase [Basidiobolus ranarum]|uniref:dolichol kinase n=1 Tax=Basidiobolus ranarum TaxID=34480 RepID=A0ABR2WQS3_9FUNG
MDRKSFSSLPTEHFIIIASVFYVLCKAYQYLTIDTTVLCIALGLLSILSWSVTQMSELGHIKLWRTQSTWYRPRADEGFLYGCLFVPFVLLAKILDLQSTGHRSDVFLEYYLSLLELSVVFGYSVLMHSITGFIHQKNLGFGVLFSGLLAIAFLAKEIFPHLGAFSAMHVFISVCVYQISMYLITGVLRRSFTFGEMAVVSQGITLVFLDALAIAIKKLDLGYLPEFVSSEQDPFYSWLQGLLLGMAFLGLTLSPSLFILRKNSNIPENETRDWQVLISSVVFYFGTVAVVLAVILPWISLVLGQNAIYWVLSFIFSKWGHLGLCLYWVSILGIAVAFIAQFTYSVTTSAGLNLKRKYFHGLAVLMFAPGYLYEKTFMHLAFTVALCAIIYVEYLRSFTIPPFGRTLHSFLVTFLDHRDSGPVILSHMYLLLGCATPIWLNGRFAIANLSGVFTLGLGDAMASIVGKRFGKTRWPGTSKTIEGTVAFILSMMAGSFVVGLLSESAALSQWELWRYFTVVCVTGLLEAVSLQNDNLIIPLYTFALISTRLIS